jgi:hypothetical protein
MINSTFDRFIEIVEMYSKSYEEFENFQKNRDKNPFIPEHGDQKTGIIGEAFVYEYLLRKGKTDLKFGNASEKAWDISYIEGSVKVLNQIKTTSSFSQTRTISPIHKGWNYLFLVSLDKRFIPNSIWIINNEAIINWPKNEKNVEIITGMKMPKPDTIVISNNIIRELNDIFDDFKKVFTELYE